MVLGKRGRQLLRDRNLNAVRSMMQCVSMVHGCVSLCVLTTVYCMGV